MPLEHDILRRDHEDPLQKSASLSEQRHVLTRRCGIYLIGLPFIGSDSSDSRPARVGSYANRVLDRIGCLTSLAAVERLVGWG